MLKAIFAFLLISLSIVLLIGYSLSIEQYRGQVSSHFNGKVFHNNPGTKKGSFARALKWMLTRTPPQWQTQHYKLEKEFAKPDNLVITPIIHASVFIQSPKLNILTDPIWSVRASPFSFVGPKRVYRPPVNIDKLGKVDVVLISHNHYDHMDKKTIKKIQELYQPVFITGLGNKSILESFGAKKVIELDWWQKSENLPISFVPAQHFSGRGLFDRNYSLWGGFIINIDGKIIYFSGDTGYGPFLQDIYQKFGKIDIAILPIGAYKPRDFMKQMHMNPDDAVKAMLDLHASHALGIHFDSFARLADEPQFSAGKDLKLALESRGIDPSRFIPPVPGKNYIF